MRFNPRARLDTSRVQDAGGGLGGLGGGGMRMPIPGGRMGGGIGGLVLVIALLVISQCSGVDLTGALNGGPGTSLSTSRLSDPGDDQRYAACRSGSDANQDSDCARVAVENSLYRFWQDQLGSDFSPERAVVTFSGQVSTGGCGTATSDVGPFYCPGDMTIYLDTTFFRNVLQRQLGGPAGAFVEPYVLAHEYGHHIQNITGYMSKVRTQSGRDNDGIRLELQADCFAGMWTRAAETVPDADGNTLLEDVTDQDITEAIEAATAVGDDYIQQRTSGRVDPESWTHGSSEQRVRWFQVGYQQGDFRACDTFAATRL